MSKNMSELSPDRNYSKLVKTTKPPVFRADGLCFDVKIFTNIL